jgi:hypothetical protein
MTPFDHTRHPVCAQGAAVVVAASRARRARTMHLPSGSVELVFEPVDLPCGVGHDRDDTIPVAIGTLVFASQAFVLSPLTLNLRLLLNKDELGTKN